MRAGISVPFFDPRIPGVAADVSRAFFGSRNPKTIRSIASHARVAAQLRARIVEWNQEKNYGFLRHKKDWVFLHIRDFAEHHKPPEVGDWIQFTLGADDRGRTRATNAVHLHDGGKLDWADLVVLLVLLSLPTVAALHVGLPFLRIALYGLTITGITYLLYAHDKTRARSRRHRISESTLHFFELIGGWPGAFLAQRRLRHKCAKTGYQIAFWLIVLAYQCAAVDSLQDWRFSRAALQIARGS
jgi:uncharacterized membrane protein YsdA (DUF1294 family)/cold shock CspA family protein